MPGTFVICKGIMDFANGSVCPGIHAELIGGGCDGRDVTIPAMKRTVTDFSGAALMSRTQVPVEPGWAITVHRSMGMTVTAPIDILMSWKTPGIVCVALSRFRDPRKVTISDKGKLISAVCVDSKAWNILRK